MHSVWSESSLVVFWSTQMKTTYDAEKLHYDKALFMFDTIIDVLK